MSDSYENWVPPLWSVSCKYSKLVHVGLKIFIPDTDDGISRFCEQLLDT